MDENRKVVLKSRIIGGGKTDAPASSGEEDPDNILFGSHAAVLEPPFGPKELIRIWENSNSLSQNVDAYVTNVDGTGNRLEPVLDFDADDIEERVREALWMQNSADTSVGDMPDGPTDDEVATALTDLKRRARFEQIKFNAFIQNVNPSGSFVSLRRLMRQDLEITGNAYWEVLRNKRGNVARFVHVNVTTIRLTIADREPIEVKDKVPFGPLGFDTVVQHRFFRRFVQSINHGGAKRKAVWFKEFGDPRTISRDTGKIYPDLKTFDEKKSDPNDRPATEIYHWKIPKPGEAYGTPRWIGNLLAVLGSRACDEVNYNYFDNKAIPPMALLIAGGRLGDDDVTRIQDYIQNNLKGRENFHKILVIEASGDEAAVMGGQATIPTIKFERLMDQQNADALYQKYDANNMDKVGSSFRLPKLMRGDIKDFNRATALAALRFAEEQVFEPERREFDDQFQRRILVDLDMRMWRFRSLPVTTRDLESIGPVIAEQLRAGSIVANEAREMLSAATGKEFPPVDADWAKEPLPIVLARIGKDTVDGEGDIDLKREGGQPTQAMRNFVADFVKKYMDDTLVPHTRVPGHEETDDAKPIQ